MLKDEGILLISGSKATRERCQWMMEF